MDINKNNFDSIVDEVCEFIRTCDYYAIDTECTGLFSRNNRYSILDTPERSVQVASDTAKRYGIIQLGLCTMHYRENSYFEARPFNIFLFPSSQSQHGEFNERSLEKDISLCPSSIKFNSKHHMDFERWIKDGVPYCSGHQLLALKASIAQELQEKDNIRKRASNREGILTLIRQMEDDPDSKTFTEYFLECEKLTEKFLSESSTREYRLPQAPNKKVHTLLKNYIEALHAPAILVALRNNVNRYPLKDLVLVKLSKEEQTVFMSRSEAARRTRILSFEGFRKVYQAMIRSRKPIVGHNCLVDVLLLMEAFDDYPLPGNDLSELKKRLSVCFPLLLDTKVIASDLEFFPADRFNILPRGRCLSALYYTYRFWGASEPSLNPVSLKIQLPFGFNIYRDSNERENDGKRNSILDTAISNKNPNHNANYLANKKCAFNQNPSHLVQNLINLNSLSVLNKTNLVTTASNSFTANSILNASSSENFGFLASYQNFLNQGASHEAGFDAYMTACVLLYLLKENNLLILSSKTKLEAGKVDELCERYSKGSFPITKIDRKRRQCNRIGGYNKIDLQVVEKLTPKAFELFKQEPVVRNSDDIKPGILDLALTRYGGLLNIHHSLYLLDVSQRDNYAFQSNSCYLNQEKYEGGCNDVYTPLYGVILVAHDKARLLQDVDQQKSETIGSDYLSPKELESLIQTSFLKGKDIKTKGKTIEPFSSILLYEVRKGLSFFIISKEMADWGYIRLDNSKDVVPKESYNRIDLIKIQELFVSIIENALSPIVTAERFIPYHERLKNVDSTIKVSKECNVFIADPIKPNYISPPMKSRQDLHFLCKDGQSTTTLLSSFYNSHNHISSLKEQKRSIFSYYRPFSIQWGMQMVKRALFKISKQLFK